MMNLVEPSARNRSYTRALHSWVKQMATNSTAFSPLDSAFERYKCASLAHQTKAAIRRELGGPLGMTLARLIAIQHADAAMMLSAADLEETRAFYLS